MIEDVVADGCCVYIVRRLQAAMLMTARPLERGQFLISEGIRQGTASRTRTPPSTFKRTTLVNCPLL